MRPKLWLAQTLGPQAVSFSGFLNGSWNGLCGSRTTGPQEDTILDRSGGGEFKFKEGDLFLLASSLTVLIESSLDRK
jgi:hypothetical protein